MITFAFSWEFYFAIHTPTCQAVCVSQRFYDPKSTKECKVCSNFKNNIIFFVGYFNSFINFRWYFSFHSRKCKRGEFPAQMASNAENVSIWWRHHIIVTASVEGRHCSDNKAVKVTTCQIHLIFILSRDRGTGQYATVFISLWDQNIRAMSLCKSHGTLWHGIND